jgi:hypothetical protein
VSSRYADKNLQDNKTEWESTLCEFYQIDIDLQDAPTKAIAKAIIQRK